MATLEERQAERDKLKQARTVIDSQAYTREDYRHRCAMEPVRPVTLAGLVVLVLLGWIRKVRR